MRTIDVGDLGDIALGAAVFGVGEGDLCVGKLTSGVSRSSSLRGTPRWRIHAGIAVTGPGYFG